MQLVAKDNSQAAFRLAQIGPHYILMKHLAEAETLALMNATVTSPSQAVPLKLKVVPRRRWTHRQESMAKARMVQQLMFLANGFVADWHEYRYLVIYSMGFSITGWFRDHGPFLYLAFKIARDNSWVHYLDWTPTYFL